MKHVIIGIVVAMLLVTVVACKGKKKTIAVTETLIEVTTAPVDLVTMRDEFKTTGTVKGIEDVNVYSKVQGKLIEYKVREGQWVKKDDVIALIDRDVTGVEYEPAPVKSPINGIIGKTFCDQGEMVMPGQKPIALVSNMSMIEVKVSVPESYVSRLRNGLKVILTSDDANITLTGWVDKVAPVANSMTHTIETTIRSSNPNTRLRSGMFVRASLIFSETKRLAIPEEALINGQTVFIAVKDEKKTDGQTVPGQESFIARAMTVKTGIFYNTYIEITEGLKKGDQIIIVGQRSLDDGVKLKVR